MQGKVVSKKTEKTVIVQIESLGKHPMYKKRVKKTARFAAHNELEVKEGDFVEIKESKPFSKTKKFLVTKVLEKTIKEKK